MEIPFFEFLKMTAEETGLQNLLLTGEQEILLFFALLSLGACFAGFRIYRPIASAAVMTLVIFCGYHWLCPAWGMLKGVTFCAVMGVSAAVVTFLCYRFAAMAFGAVTAASLFYQIFGGLQLPLWGLLLLLLIPAVGAAVLTHFFPFWSVAGFTALWGSLTFLFGGLQALLPQTAGIHGALLGLLAVILFACGFALQLVLFRKQKLFQKIMPDRVRYRLEQKKLHRKGGSAVA